MSEQTFFNVVGIFTLVIAALVGAFWKHVYEDIRTRERVASLETDNVTLKRDLAEIKSRRRR